MSRLSEVPYERVVEMEDFIRDQTHGDKAREITVRSIIGETHAKAVRRGDSKIAFSLLVEAIDVVWNRRQSLAPIIFAPDPYHDRLWLHPDKSPDQTKAAPWTVKGWTPGQKVVESAAVDCLRHPWMFDGHIDQCYVDALTNREIVGYKEVVASMVTKAWTTGQMLQKLFAVWIPWLIEIGIAAGSLAWLRAEFASSEESSQRWWSAAAIVAYYAWWVSSFVIRIPATFRFRRTRQKMCVETADRLQAMYRCYAELSGPVFDSTQVGNAMLAATKVVLEYLRAMWPLLQDAIARDPHRWLTTPG